MLIAWLKQADAWDNKMEHEHCCLPSLAERQEARAWLESVEGSETFFALRRSESQGIRILRPVQQQRKVLCFVVLW